VAEEVDGQPDVTYPSIYAINANGCVKCRSCVVACPTKSIAFLEDQLYKLDESRYDRNYLDMEMLRVGWTSGSLGRESGSTPRDPQAL